MLSNCSHIVKLIAIEWKEMPQNIFLKITRNKIHLQQSYGFYL